MKKSISISSKQLLKLTIDSLEDDKGIDICKIDLIGRSSIADYMIVVSGNTTRQVTSMANNLVKNIKKRAFVHLRPKVCQMVTGFLLMPKIFLFISFVPKLEISTA